MIKLEAFSLADRVVQQLLEELLAGRLAPGTRLREIELADRLGVSRTPIREALGRLARDGLVELLPNRGAIVRDLGGDELRHIYQLREIGCGVGVRTYDAGRFRAARSTRRGRRARRAAISRILLGA